MIALKDIAAAANVSVSTVSLALRNDPRIKASRREMVKNLAQKMGYTPNPMLSALASRQFRTSVNFEGVGIAFFTYLPLQEKGKDTETEARVNAYLECMKSHVGKIGYHVEHVELSSQRSLPALGRMLHHRGFEGIVIGPILNLTEPLDFPWENFCVVACGEVEPLIARNFHWIKTDFFRVTRCAYQRAWDAGYRRIAVVLNGKNEDMEETDSCLAALNNAGRLLHPETDPLVYILRDDPEGHTGSPAGKKFLPWLNTHQPDCLIGYSMGLYHALKKNGFRVPDDIGYISLHIRDHGLSCEKVCGYFENQLKLGHAALEEVDRQIHYGIRGYAGEPRGITLLPDWLDGVSLPVRTG